MQKALRIHLRSWQCGCRFSGGVDSTFLLKEAQDFCRQNGIRHIVCRPEEPDIDGFRQNPKNRCYLCKRVLRICWAAAPKT